MGRTWQCGTIQVDFAMPERLDITYTGSRQRRASAGDDPPRLLGRIERFMGILLEHYGGNLPTWLAPVQALVLPVADRTRVRAGGRCAPCGPPARPARGAARQVHVEIDDRSESSANASATANCRRCPTCSCVGDREPSAAP